MLKARIITAAIGLPLLLAILFFAEPIWLIPLFMIFVALSTYEMATMVLPKMQQLAWISSGGLEPRPSETPPTVFIWGCVFLALFAFGASSAGSLESGRGMIVAALLGAIFVGAFSAKDVETAGCLILGFLLSVSYGALPWLAIWDLYLMGEHARYLIFLLAVVWSGDTGGYFGGRYFGKHKLAPRMSPKKTWEGAVFGIIASLAGGMGVNALYSGALAPWSVVFVASFFGGAFGQLGDLVESLIKRFCGVKDSGVIVPGHGGFLDRADGLIFAAPIVWFILYNFAG